MNTGRDVAVQSGTIVNDNQREEFPTVEPANASAPASADASVPAESSAPADASAPAPADASAPASADASAPAESSAPADATAGAKTDDSAYLASLSKQLGTINKTLQGVAVEGGPEEQAAVARLGEIDTAMDDLTSQLEAGTIGHDVMMKQMASLMSERAQIDTRLEIGKQDRQNAERGAQDAFLTAYPDFSDFARSEDAQQIIAANPYVMNNVSAYFAAQHAKVSQENSVLQSQIAQMQAERDAAIKNAGQAQTKVIGGQKQAVQPVTAPANAASYNDRAHAALARVRNANGQ